MNESRLNEIWHAVLGVGTSAAGIAVSTLTQVEIWMRIASLAIGIFVGLLTSIILLRRLFKGDTRTET